MEINKIDSKNLIITTEFGSKIEIKNNQTIIFGNNEIGLNKVKSVGDINIGITDENIESEITKLTTHKKYSKILSILLFVVYIPVYYSYDHSASVGRQLGLGKQDNTPVDALLVMFLATLGYFIFTHFRIKSVEGLDFTKNNYPLSVKFEFIDGKKKETKSYVVGYGSMKELKELKQIILDKKVDSLLS
jgi:hypothetical protein